MDDRVRQLAGFSVVVILDMGYIRLVVPPYLRGYLERPRSRAHHRYPPPAADRYRLIETGSADRNWGNISTIVAFGAARGRRYRIIQSLVDI